ncbi:MAG: PilW family protein, partial [Pseudomonadota bacterium]
SQVNNHINGNADPTDLYFFEPLEGSESAANWEPGNSTDEVSSMLTGTDGITIRYLAPTDVNVMNPAVTLGSSQIHISAESGLEMGDAIVISDCASADAVIITSNPNTSGCSGTGQESTGPSDTCKTTVTHSAGTPGAGAEPGNANATLTKAYTEEAELLRYITHRYYIANDPSGAPMLFRQSGFNQVDAMVEGVENMQIMYGEDTSGADEVADVYVQADSVSDWADVVSVRISLLIRSVEEYGGDLDSATYSLLGNTVGPLNDRRRRRVFTATVDVRNRSLQ